MLEKFKAGSLTGAETKELLRYEGQRTKPGPRPDPDYDEREAQRQLMARKRAAAREITIDFSRQNMRRRNRLSKNPEKFCRTYFPHIFYLPFSDGQRQDLAAIVDRMHYGGLQANAAPRGDGKTTIVKGALVYGLVYQLIQWGVIVEANLDMAKATLEDIKTFFEKPFGDDLFGADFPEYCDPIRALGGKTQLAGGQLYGGKLTGIKWTTERIILPTIHGIDTPKNTPARPGIVQVFGADKPIRGLVYQGMRPDLVILNDLETEETAKSLTMTTNIKNNVEKGVLGLGGPTEPIAVVMLCTIIRRGCLADMLTDRQKYPEWQGRRRRMLIEMPHRTDLWEKYMHLRAQEMRSGKPVARKADAFYRKNRKIMDAGAIVSNPRRYIKEPGPDGKPLEISALQHAYNLISRMGWLNFLCECQNDPPEELTETMVLDENQIIEKLNDLDEAALPEGTAKITAFVDVHDQKLFWAVVAWKEGFIGYVIEYGVERVLSPIAGTVSADERERQVELAMLDGLHNVARQFERGWPEHDTGAMRGADLVLVDAGYKPDPVFSHCQTTLGNWRPSMGGSSRRGQYTTPKPSRSVPVRTIGDGFHQSLLPRRRIPLIIFDPDKYKKRAQEGLLVPGVEVGGSISLFGQDPIRHRTFAEHIAAEAWHIEKLKYERVPGKQHNHWLDCLAGCCAGAAMLGVRLIASNSAQAMKKVSFKQRQQAKLHGRE